MLFVVTFIHVFQILQTAHEQARAHKQRNRERHLENQQQPAEPLLESAGDAARRVFQRRGELDAGGLPGRSKSKQDRSRQRYQRGKSDHAGVGCDDNSHRSATIVG